MKVLLFFVMSFFMLFDTSFVWASDKPAFFAQSDEEKCPDRHYLMEFFNVRRAKDSDLEEHVQNLSPYNRAVLTLQLCLYVQSLNTLKGQTRARNNFKRYGIDLEEGNRNEKVVSMYDRDNSGVTSR